MKLPFFPVYILSGKELAGKIAKAKTEAAAAEFKVNSKWIHGVLIENAMLKIKYQSKF
jgi:hypothetical protein